MLRCSLNGSHATECLSNLAANTRLLFVFHCHIFHTSSVPEQETFEYFAVIYNSQLLHPVVIPFEFLL